MTEEIFTDDQSETKEQHSSFLEEARKKLPLDLVPLVVLVIVVGIVILFANDWKFWDGQNAVEETNDAYIRADITPLSTKVSGTVARVLINDFDRVRKGQLLVELRNDDFTAAERRARFEHDQAMANTETIKQQMKVQEDKIEEARISVKVQDKEQTRTNAVLGATDSTLEIAAALLEEAKASKLQAQAKCRADQAVHLKASQERQRQEELFSAGAATQQTIEQVVAEDERTRAQVSEDEAEINRLSNLIKARGGEIARQRHEVVAAHAQNSQSDLNIASRDSQLKAAQRQLDVLKEQLKQSQFQTLAAQEAWNKAKVELDYTKVFAPVDGTLSERQVRAGQQVNAGTQVVTIVSAVPWVIASYRETQTRRIDVGARAEVSVDALGGAILKGKVQALSPASEAQFALLPPDNPSGNFTKITQRVPVKIQLDENQKFLDRIKPGMTVIAKVWTH
ncbi:MAG: HlyD family secretion protein [Cyanobacteria bacterium SZAS TMP-1]|nr:HlyD family secretion protein [Cyanobacteria bacterium SZAS TMP-1]